MSARQFAKAVKRVSVTPLKLSRARRVLVDGELVRDVADSEGVGLAAIYKAVRMVCAGHHEKVGYWPGLAPAFDDLGK